MHLRHRPWRVILAFLFFSIPFTVLLVLTLLGKTSLFSAAGVLLLISGAFPIGGIALLPALSRRTGAGDGPTALQWIFLGLAVAMWSAAPVVGFLGSGDWNSVIGDGPKKSMPLWMLAAITWSVALLILGAGFLQARRASKARARLRAGAHP